jgi:hypothetical protein
MRLLSFPFSGNISSGEVSFWKKEARNPAPEDIPPYENALWLNTETGEIFVHLKNCSEGAFWKGQFGTIIAPSTVTKFDIFEDGSAVALYRFEGNALDDGGQFNGVWTGTEQYDVGIFGQAAKFDGNSYISSNVCDALNDAVSISFWVSPGSGILFNFGAYTLEAQVSSGLQVAYGDGWSWITVSSLPAGEWKHIVFSYEKSGGTCSVWIDGNQVYEGNNSSSASWGDFCLAWRLDNSSDPKFNGLIDQVRIFNRALTDEEVQVLYNEVEVNC